MPLEPTVNYINDLNESWPVGDTDPKAQGDDHLRNIKKALKQTFPGADSPFALAIGSPFVGDILYFDGNGWRNLPIGSTDQLLTVKGSPSVPTWTTGPVSLAGLTDTNIGSPATGNALIWNGTYWIPGLPTVSLDDLTDVTITSAAEGEFLRYSGSAWVNTDFVEADAVEVEVRNDTGATLNEGDVVYQTGYSTPGKAITVALADASDPSKMPALGIVKNGGIANNSNGYVVVNGTASSLNTNGLTQNQAIYVDTTPGQYTTTRPSNPAHAVQKIGVIGRVNNSNGTITVVGAGRTNDVPNEIANPMFVTESAYLGASATEKLRIQATSGPTVRLHGGSVGSPPGRLEFNVNSIQYFWPTALGGSPAAGQVLAYNTDGQMYWTAAGGGGLANVVEDLTPQLGGNLDVNDKNINNSGTEAVKIWEANGFNVRLTASTSGGIVLDAQEGGSAITPGNNQIVIAGSTHVNGGIWITTDPAGGGPGGASGNITIETVAGQDVEIVSSDFVWNTNTVATQTWVSSQGYLTAGSPQGTFVQAGDNISRLTNDAGYLTAGSPQGTFVQAGDNISRLTNDAGYVTSFGSPGSKVEKLETSSIVGSPAGSYTISSADFDKKNETYATTIVVPGGVLETGRTVNLWLNNTATVTKGTGSPNLDFAAGAGSPNASISKGWLTLYNTGSSTKVQ